ncbi:MAG: hypothetical protein ACRD1Z_08245, partial [Vicinamibacteria bacterium]
LQVSALRFIPFTDVKPDLLLILVIYLSLSPRTMGMALLVFCFGAIEDIFSAGPDGLFAILRVAAWWLSGLISGRMYFEAKLNRTVYIFFYSLADGLLLLALLAAFGNAGNLFPYLGKHLPLYGLLNAGAAFLLWPLLRAADRLVSTPREEARLEVRVGY